MIVLLSFAGQRRRSDSKMTLYLSPIRIFDLVMFISMYYFPYLLHITNVYFILDHSHMSTGIPQP